MNTDHSVPPAVSSMEFLHRAGLSSAQILKLDELGYWSAPASKGHHLAVPGGLVLHSANVTARLVSLSEAWRVDWPREESPYIVGMLHDLVKTACYALDEEAWDRDRRYAYRYVHPSLPGHGLASVLIAESQLGVRLRAAERMSILYHMGRFGVGSEYSEESFDRDVASYPDAVLATHAADWYAAKVDERTDPVGGDASEDVTDGSAVAPGDGEGTACF